MSELARVCRKWSAVCLALCALPSAAENVTCRIAGTQISRRASEVPSVVIPYMPAAPKIDGVIGQAEWKGAESVSGFVTPGTGVDADPQTTAWLGVDRRNIYVAIRCHLVPGSKPRAEMRKRDAQVWLDDSVELYLQPDTSKREYFQIIVNPVGGQYDGRDTFDGSLRREFPDWTPATKTRTGREPNAWTVEMSVPLTSVGLKPGGVKAVRLNFFRSEHWQTWRPSSWAYLPANNPHTPSSFGVGIVTFGVPRGKQFDLGSVKVSDGSGLLLVEQKPPAVLLPGSLDITARLALPDKLFSASTIRLETRVIPISGADKKGKPIPAGSFTLRSANPVKLSVSGLSPGNYRLDISAKWKGGQTTESLPIMVRRREPEPEITGAVVIDDRDWRTAKADGVENTITQELLLKTELKPPVTAFDPTDDETITCMTEFQGKLYVGSCTEPKNTATGSVFTYDADLDVWEKVFQVNEEGLVSMEVFGDKLYIPGLDADDGGWDLGNIYIHDGKSWIERRTVPYAIHIYGVARYKDRLYLSADIAEWPPGMDSSKAEETNVLKVWGSVLSSDDEGQTWRTDYRGTEPVQDIGFMCAFKDRLVLNKNHDLVVFDGKDWTPLALVPPVFSVYDYAPDGDVLLVGTQLGLFFYDGERFRPSAPFRGFHVRSIERFGEAWVLAGYYEPSDSPASYVRLAADVPRVFNQLVVIPDDVLKEPAKYGGEWWKKVNWINPPEMCVSAKCFRGRLYLGTHHADGRVLVLPVVKEGTLESAARRVESAGEYKLWWSAATPPGTSVAFQIRAADSEAELEGKPFIGPDGTKNSYFRTQGAQIRMAGPGFIQYRVKLATDNPARSPYIKRVVVTRARQ